LDGHVQIGKSIHNEMLQEDYWKSKPSLAKIKLANFVKEFEVAYKAS
jgi:ribosomal protein L16 Arg81 hydroxylase